MGGVSRSEDNEQDTLKVRGREGGGEGEREQGHRHQQRGPEIAGRFAGKLPGSRGCVIKVMEAQIVY